MCVTWGRLKLLVGEWQSASHLKNSSGRRESLSVGSRLRPPGFKAWLGHQFAQGGRRAAPCLVGQTRQVLSGSHNGSRRVLPLGRGSHAGSGTPRLLGTWDAVWQGAGGRVESPWGRQAGCSMNPVACPTAAHLAREKVGHSATPASAAGTRPGDIPGSSPVTTGQCCPTGLSGWWKHLKSVLLVQWPLPAGDTELSFRLY